MKNKDEDEHTKAVAGESLAMIMLKLGEFKEFYLTDLDPVARHEVEGVFLHHNMEWFERLKKIK